MITKDNSPPESNGLAKKNKFDSLSMEDTIAQKRKELEEPLKKFKYLNETQIEWLNDKVKCFNLGVELASKENEIAGNSRLFKAGYKEGRETARKEFIELLENDKYISNSGESWDNVNRQEHHEKIIDNLIEELKQKLGEDKT